jgi:hypothetical protein
MNTNFYEQLGITSAWAVLVFVVIGYLAKKIFEFFINGTIDLKKSELERELESFKQTLSSEAQIHKLGLDKSLEEHKNSLQQISQEHQIRFSKLHLDRAETIKSLFTKLVKMELSMESYMKPFQGANESPVEDKSIIAAEDGNDFQEYYLSNQILLSDSTCKIIDSLNDNFRIAFMKHSSDIRRQKLPYNRIAENNIDPYFDILKKEIPKLKRTLTDDFRNILGVL